MKQLLFIVVFLVITSAISAQDIIFNIDQAGYSHKNTKTGMFEEAELQDAKLTIKMQNLEVKLNDGNQRTYKLVKINNEKKVNLYTYYQLWQAIDETNNPVALKVTVNTKSKQAVIEVGEKVKKSYFFGTCSSSEKLTKL